MKIILLSDSHFYDEALNIVRRKYRDADLLIHCGDCLLPPERMKGFLTVAGNLDDARQFPMEETLEKGNFKILIKHGHDVIAGSRPDYSALANDAKTKGYNTVFFGHTHVYCDKVVNGVRLLNPGSVWKNRDDSPACLMEIELTETTLTAKKKTMNDVQFG